MKNSAVVEILEQFADLLEFKGENPFKVNAYRRAARAVQDLTEDIEKIWQEGRLHEIPGIGEAIQGKLDQFLREGRIRQFDELVAEAPREIFKLLAIQNFGPKTAALAYRELGVETLEDLRRVLEDGSLAKLPGMGAKKVENIRKGLEHYENAAAQISIGLASMAAAQVIEYLQESARGLIGRIEAAGSVRRFKETVHDLDILVESSAGEQVVQLFTQMTGVTQVLGAGSSKGSVILNDRLQADLRVVPSESFGAALQYFTGSQAHNVRIREIAKKMGLKVNEYGVFRGEERIAGKDEQEVYAALGLAWIPPELREDRGEIEAAQNNSLPELVQLADIRGDLHLHTRYSDGQFTIAEMAEAAQARGYEYIAVCDHSKSAFYANGLDEERLRRSIEEIRRYNEEHRDFVIFAGAEVDILPDGSLDYPDALLAELDFVVASIHSAFKQNPTGRTLAALDNPYVDVIGHPTGRLISRREGFEIDVEQIIVKAAACGAALEVNSFWDRLDLRDVYVRQAIEHGVKIVINTDAHHIQHLGYMALGVGTARRGWAKKSDVLNTLSADELNAWRRKRIQTRL